VTIPLGSGNVTLTVDAVDNALAEPSVLVTISATAAGYAAGAVVIEVTDDDTPPIAITNAIIYAESFETLADGAPLLPARGWYTAMTQNCTVVQDNYAYGRPLPLDTAHTQVAAIGAPVTNRIGRAPAQPAWFDVMISPHLGEVGGQMPDENETGVLFGEHGQVLLFHRDLHGGTNRWTELQHAPIASGDWVRVTMAVDYATEDPAHPGIRFFRLFVDGTAIISAYALTDNRGGGLPGGSWFATHPLPEAEVNELSFHNGPCRLDDVVVTTAAPAAPQGTPWPWLADHGLVPEEEDSDTDRDGFSARQEYIALTDPRDPESRFEIQAIDLPKGDARIGVSSAAGRLYTLQQQDALGQGEWQTLPEWRDVPGTGAMLWLQPTNGAPARFFRATVRLPE
jgi:hypothetical protein